MPCSHLTLPAPGAECFFYLHIRIQPTELAIEVGTRCHAGMESGHFAMERRDVVEHLSELGDELRASSGVAPGAEVASNHLGPLLA